MKNQAGDDIGRRSVGFLSHWQPDENDEPGKKRQMNSLSFIICTVQVSL